MKNLKKITVIIITFVMVVCMNINTYAKAGWMDYLGFDGKYGHTWCEASNGEVTNVKKNKWTVKLKQIGWGGISCGQMYRRVNVKKKQKYRLKFKIKSTKVNKWVFVGISQGEKYAYGKWIWLKKNKYKTVDVKFKAQSNANQITFAFGGDHGNIEYQKQLYDWAVGGSKTIAAKRDANGDLGPHKKTITKIILKNYSFKKIKNKFK